jgi:hypothetical protein
MILACMHGHAGFFDGNEIPDFMVFAEDDSIGK